MEWIHLDNTIEIEHLLIESQTQTVVIFKHSPSCYISKMVLRSFESVLSDKNDLPKMLFYFVDVINNRDVSQALANTLNIQHESPQLLVIKDSVATMHKSHSAISAEELLEIA